MVRYGLVRFGKVWKSWCGKAGWCHVWQGMDYRARSGVDNVARLGEVWSGKVMI